MSKFTLLKIRRPPVDVNGTLVGITKDKTKEELLLTIIKFINILILTMVRNISALLRNQLRKDGITEMVTKLTRNFIRIFKSMVGMMVFLTRL